MSHLQANLRTSELLSSVLFRVPECLLFIVLFVSKGQHPSKSKELEVISILGPQKVRLIKSSLVLTLA
jgi:hypothetical protein